jgi:magnesium-transporting ATPase (P-type)
MADVAPISHIAEVISQSIAPAFILGAVSGFTSVLVTRLNRIIDRCRALAAEDKDQTLPHADRVDIAVLNRRAALINRAIFWAVCSALVTILLMVVAFIEAFFEISHERAIAVFFVVALGLFGTALVNFSREVRIALNDPNNFD